MKGVTYTVIMLTFILSFILSADSSECNPKTCDMRFCRKVCDIVTLRGRRAPFCFNCKIEIKPIPPTR